MSWRSGYPNRRPRSTVKQGCFYSTTISLVLRSWPSVCSDSRVSYEKIYGDSYFIRVVQDRLLNTKIYLNNSTNKDSKIEEKNFKDLFLRQGSVSRSTLRFSTLFHNYPAAHQDHCGRCRNRTRDSPLLHKSDALPMSQTLI